MQFLGPLITALGLTGSVQGSVSTLDAYITKEADTAKSSLLANIGPDGAQSHDALVCNAVLSPRVVLRAVICNTGRFSGR